DPPRAFGPDLLRRGIAQKLQEDIHGGPSATTRRLLKQLTNFSGAKVTGRILLPRRIKQDAVLIREWKSKSHRVTVLHDGFGYEGRTYKNLSLIAREITGTRWNGPRFFGLRKAEGGREI